MAATNDASTAIISPNTNRLVAGGTDVKYVPVYWCKVCSVKLGSTTTALAHLRGKTHKSKLNVIDSSDLNSEKVKVEEKVESHLECKICNLQLSTPFHALQHFKGKKHSSRKRALDTSIAKQTVSGVQQPASKKIKQIVVSGKAAITEQQLSGKAATKEQQLSGKAATKEQQLSGKAATKEKGEMKDNSVKCEDCSIEFQNFESAIQHFKGKRHIATIRKKMEAKQPQKSVSQRGGRGRGRGNKYTRVNTARFNCVPFKPFNAGKLSEYFVKSGQAKIQPNNSNPPLLKKFNPQGRQHNEQVNTQQQSGVGNRSVQQQHAQCITEANTSVKHRIYEREYEDNIQQLIPNKFSNHTHNNKYNQSSGNFSDNYSQGNNTLFGNHGPGNGNHNNYGQRSGNNYNNYRQDGCNLPDNYDQSNDDHNDYGQGYSNFPDNYDGGMDSSNMNGNEIYDTY